MDDSLGKGTGACLPVCETLIEQQHSPVADGRAGLRCENQEEAREISMGFRVALRARAHITLAAFQADTNPTFLLVLG